MLRQVDDVTFKSHQRWRFSPLRVLLVSGFQIKPHFPTFISLQASLAFRCLDSFIWFHHLLLSEMLLGFLVGSADFWVIVCSAAPST